MPLERIVCPVCGVDDTRQFIPWGPRDIVRCRQCGLAYVNPRRLPGEVSAFFETKYISRPSMLSDELGAARAGTLKREADLVQRFKHVGRILDIGCAGGEFLAQLLARGWECHGVEPSRLAVKEAERRGIRVYPGLFLEAQINLESYFDAIVYLDALPFSATPLEDLRKVRGLLKPDGILMVELPGLLYRLTRNVGPVGLVMNRRWCQFSSASPHLFYYSTSSFARLLARSGFHIQWIELEKSPEHGKWTRWLNEAYWGFAKRIFRATGKQVNLAAKVVYVCARR